MSDTILRRYARLAPFIGAAGGTSGMVLAFGGMNSRAAILWSLAVVLATGILIALAFVDLRSSGRDR